MIDTLLKVMDDDGVYIDIGQPSCGKLAANIKQLIEETEKLEKELRDHPQVDALNDEEVKYWEKQLDAGLSETEAWDCLKERWAREDLQGC